LYSDCYQKRSAKGLRGAWGRALCSTFALPKGAGAPGDMGGMKINRLVFSIITISFTTFVWANTLTVGPFPNYTSIGAAVTAAQDGDTIVVKRNPGVPYETFNVVVDKKLHIMSEPDSLTGDLLPAECILDPSPNNGHIFEVLVQNNLGSDSDIIIEGFTFQNGNAPALYGGGGTDANGGAIRIEESRATIRHCVFSGNQANGGGGLAGGNGAGGAISLIGLTSGTHATIENCNFSNNEVLGGNGTILDGKGLGGAVFIQNAAAEFTLCDFISNSSTGGSQAGPEVSSGGAVCAIQGGGTFTGCRFVSNSAGEAGGFYVESGGAFFTNCVLASNTARSGNGGACYFSEPGSLITLLNSTVASNSAGGQGGAAYGENAYFLEVFNSIIWDNTATVSDDGVLLSLTSLSCKNSDVQGSPWTTFGGNDGGNISATPFFVNATNFRLLAASPCINSGSNTLISGVTTDLDGSARIDSGTVDMGAYETSIVTFINNIKAAVDAIGSLPGDGQSLKQKLTLASSAITAGDYSRAINHLNDFISKVNQMVPRKMSAANAATLTAMAQEIINMFL